MQGRGSGRQGSRVFRSKATILLGLALRSREDTGLGKHEPGSLGASKSPSADAHLEGGHGWGVGVCGFVTLTCGPRFGPQGTHHTN